MMYFLAELPFSHSTVILSTGPASTRLEHASRMLFNYTLHCASGLGKRRRDERSGDGDGRKR
jgi:hypothetical protein